MLLCAISDFKHQRALHPRFAALARFLEQTKLRDLPPGRTAIEGEDLLVIVDPAATPRLEAPLEAHRTYIDVQVVVSGTDTMGWAPLSACGTVTQPYDPDKDIIFFAEKPLSFVPVPQGHLAIFFPEDAHAPLTGMGGPVHKLVFKVRAATV